MESGAPDSLLWLWMALHRALQFVPPASEVLAEMKTTIFYDAFRLLIHRLELLQSTI